MPAKKPEPETLVIESPLKAWPGEVELPRPDDFNGVHWQIWKGAVNKAGRKPYALTHLYCYAGLELIEAAGAWNIDAPALDEIKAWEQDPDAERIKLVAWLGRSIMGYMDDIMDPKG
jgi:hypothetical protein